ncbi:hypothetical protein FRB96_000302 [Tulasnella sp. 330]|nr:hypothetical protein FRB96_000302 [Tulasnella sp. 330]KAG8877829.1 hypothetical protein FRB97_003109 [Tulasnella sp. 331]
MPPQIPNQNTFDTLVREHRFRHPTKEGSTLPVFQDLVAPHLESFNAITEGSAGNDANDIGLLNLGLSYVPEKVVFDQIGRDGVDLGKGLGNRLSMRIENAVIGRPMISENDREAKERRIYPSEARERLTTYRARLSVKIVYTVNGGEQQEITRDCGLLPIMVRSNRCNLRGMSSAELVKHHEEAEEFGGYFIVNGNEKIIRYLVLNRRNYPLALVRNSFTKRGPTYTPYGISIRCVRQDESSLTNVLHYCANGTAMLRFTWRKNEYMIPIMLILKALVSSSDKEIFEGVIMKDYNNTFMTDRVELLLRSFKSYNLFTGEQCLRFLGEKFRVVLDFPEDFTDFQLGCELMDKVILVHIENPRDKYRMLIFMLRKLLALVSGECCQDNPDSPANHEVLLPGYLYSMIIRERLEVAISDVKRAILSDLQKNLPGVNFHDNRYISKVVQKVKGSFDIGAKMANFLATGNLVSPTGLDLQQAAGFTIVAEKLNWYRYISHFRCIHRGAFFADQKTTTVRKLLPEAWGFMCPVHTPDGTPCGLLNHLARECRLITKSLDVDHIPGLLSSLGMTERLTSAIDGRNNLSVQLDGRVIGWGNLNLCRQLATALRIWKTEGKNSVPMDLEIGLVPPSNGGQYPGLYLFSSKARMMRSVLYLPNGREDSIGSFEQVYLDIAVKPEEVSSGEFTHVELSPTSFLSILATLTPFSDFNQSPRNIYQCQMGKQSMGTPSTSIQHRTDNKMYRLQCGQTPIVRPDVHNLYGMDSFPNGTNAVVAVISYTGYDMEDAMILNKSSHERGFGYGTIYKSITFDLRKEQGGFKAGPIKNHFGLGHDVRREHPSRDVIDSDGLPQVGAKIEPKGIIAAYINDTNGRTQFLKYKGDETGFVDTVRLLGNDAGDSEAQQVQITIRIPRSPVIGDKFSSRHGQKGVCSQKWPTIDMPFSESGMQPDVIINPHAFPSRMTIGMFVESMAGKAGAMHGIAQDATPFKFTEQDTAVNYFGKQLLASGYNYFGNEPMYSGITGQEFHADIYLGVVYYQRLRHMVLDKFQVRTTGPVDQVTRQPIKGRKRGGGIRFGEMERDALLAHGTSFLLQDRLMNCSDYSTAWVCRTCGSLISLGYEDVSLGEVVLGKDTKHIPAGPMGEYCRVCRAEAEVESTEVRKAMDLSSSSLVVGRKPLVGNVRIAIPPQNILGQAVKGGDMDVIAVPFVFRYLCAELAAMGIKLSLECS